METIIIILQLLFLLFFGTATAVHTPPEPIVVTVSPPTAPVDGDAQAAEPMMRTLAVVESVDVLLLESMPVQIQLQVSGYHPDGCQAAVEVVQRRDGNTVTVEVYRLLPAAVMCPMVLQPLQETIRLDGGFEPGTYQININGVVTEVTI